MSCTLRSYHLLTNLQMNFCYQETASLGISVLKSLADHCMGWSLFWVLRDDHLVTWISKMFKMTNYNLLIIFFLLIKVPVNIFYTRLAIGFNWILSRSFSISPMDFWLFFVMDFSITCSCKLALLAMWGVVGGNGGGGGGGGGFMGAQLKLFPFDKQGSVIKCFYWLLNSDEKLYKIWKFLRDALMELVLTIVDICSRKSCSSCSKANRRTSDPKLIGSKRSGLFWKSPLL